MRNFTYQAPPTLGQVHALLASHGYDAKLIGGGTSLITFMKQQLVQPELLVSLGRVAGLDGIDWSAEALTVGASVRYRDLETDPRVAERLPLLAAALARVATVRIREMATIGGGLAQADPAQDLPAVWRVLDATITVASQQRERQVPAADFFIDYYTCDLEPEETITAITVPLPPLHGGWAYEKFLSRSADDFATVSAAALVVCDAHGIVTDARLGLGSVAPTPLLLPEVTEPLVGLAAGEVDPASCCQPVVERVDPLDDARGSADYKRRMARVFAGRALAAALQRATAASATGG